MLGANTYVGARKFAATRLVIVTLADAWKAADDVALVTYLSEEEGVLLPDFSRLVQPYGDLDRVVEYGG